MCRYTLPPAINNCGSDRTKLIEYTQPVAVISSVSHDLALRFRPPDITWAVTNLYGIQVETFFLKSIDPWSLRL